MSTEKKVDRTQQSVALQERRNFTRILCPTDLSEGSNSAIAYAAAIARTFASKLIVCHSTEATPPGGFVNTNKVIEDALGNEVALLSGINWDGIILKGEVAEAILNLTESLNNDLIVMHSRRRPYYAALFGSTAETVCRAASCPVLVIHSGEREFVNCNTGEIALQKVLIASDLSQHSELAFSYGLSLAQEFQAELHLLHVVQPQPADGWQPPKNTKQLNAAEQLRNSVPEEAFLWCNIQWYVREGLPYHEILNYARERDIDLICMGAHGQDYNQWSLFGSNADRVLRQAPCPVLIARK